MSLSKNILLIIGAFLDIGKEHIPKEPKELVDFFETEIKPIKDFKTLLKLVPYWNNIVDSLPKKYPNYPIFYLDQNVGKLFFYVEHFKTGIIYGLITGITIPEQLTVLKGSGTPDISRERIESKTYISKFKEPYNEVLIFKGDDGDNFINIRTVRKLIEMCCTEKIVFECVENKTDTSHSYILLELFDESLLVPIDDIRTMIRFFIQKRTRIFRLEKDKQIHKGTTYVNAKDTDETLKQKIQDSGAVTAAPRGESKSCESLDKFIYRIKPILPPVFKGEEVGTYGVYRNAASVAVADSGEVAVVCRTDVAQGYQPDWQILVNNRQIINLGQSFIPKIMFSPNNELIVLSGISAGVTSLEGKSVSTGYSNVISDSVDLAFSPYGIYKSTREQILVYTYDGKLLRKFGEGRSKQLLDHYSASFVDCGFDKIGVTPEGKVFVTKTDRDIPQPWGINIRLVTFSYDGSNQSISTLQAPWRWADSYKSIAISKDGKDSSLIAWSYSTMMPYPPFGGGVEGGTSGGPTTGLDFTSSGQLYCCTMPSEGHNANANYLNPYNIVKIYQ
jgi:hypothetical protein